jgi:branched-chain amino acid transport system ATP-binding protein
MNDGPFKWCRVDEKPADNPDSPSGLEFLVLLFQDKRTKKLFMDNSLKNRISPRSVSSSTEQSRPLLEVRDLDASYQNVIRVLHGVNLHVYKGECVALLGGNGAGKTTTLKSISGMLEGEGSITGGSVLLDGEDVTGHPAHKMVARGLVHVLEGRYVFPDLSVHENLLMGAYTRIDRDRVDGDMDGVFGYFPRLKERLKVQAGYLSGGEQQMLAIGRALMARPKILLLDEPSMGLAPILVREVFDIVNRIRKEENVTMLLVEQNARMALQLAGRGYLIETGSIVLEGTADELREDPRLQEVYFGGMHQ